MSWVLTGTVFDKYGWNPKDRYRIAVTYWPTSDGSVVRSGDTMWATFDNEAGIVDERGTRPATFPTTNGVWEMRSEPEGLFEQFYFPAPADGEVVDFATLYESYAGVPPEAQTTGWRDIAAETRLVPVTFDFLHIMREGSRVTLRGSGTTTADTFGGDFLPDGFWPAASQLAKGLYGYEIGTVELLATLIFNGGQIGMSGLGVAGRSLDFEESWLTARPFPLPADWPGTPV